MRGAVTDGVVRNPYGFCSKVTGSWREERDKLPAISFFNILGIFFKLRVIKPAIIVPHSSTPDRRQIAEQTAGPARHPTPHHWHSSSSSLQSRTLHVSDFFPPSSTHTLTPPPHTPPYPGRQKKKRERLGSRAKLPFS